jgi:site-specific recombinase XerD
MLDLPLQIIKRYCPDFETRNGEDKIFMIISNQKTNAYLKELAKDCTISKNLTFHLARHTFATTITLNNNVPIESVSSMLGHKNITTTQHYAKLLDKKLEVDMENLDARLNYGKTKSRGT